jgi:hypothetical protein
MFSRLLPSCQWCCEDDVACSTPFLSLMHLQSYQSIDELKKNFIPGSTKGKYIFVEWNQHLQVQIKYNIKGMSCSYKVELWSSPPQAHQIVARNISISKWYTSKDWKDSKKLQFFSINPNSNTIAWFDWNILQVNKTMIF